MTCLTISFPPISSRRSSFLSPPPVPINTLPVTADSKGKKRALHPSSPPSSDPLVSLSDAPPPAKRSRKSSVTEAGRYKLRSRDEEELTNASSKLKAKGKGKGISKGKASSKKMPKKTLYVGSTSIVFADLYQCQAKERGPGRCSRPHKEGAHP